ncbi:MAG: glycosyltransferase family 4 protein, partial [Bacteroidetes bacterium]|nr:glycosyltransferase family 4 protein [Bacteroidota bacterium]
YHGVDVSLYNPSGETRTRLREEFRIPLTDTVIVSTAMLVPVKCIDRLVKAFAAACRTRHNLRLVIVGTGSEYEPLAEMAASFGKTIRERIVFLGFRNDIARLLQMSDIYVLPSDSEGLPLACLEAMSTGLICMATDSGGTAEVIRDGQNGFLVERSEAGVTEGVQKVLDLCDEKRREISANARDFVKQHFNLESNIRSGLGVLRLDEGLGTDKNAG